MKYLYVDCFSGISGDMFLAALLDAGLPLDYLKGQLHRLNIPEHFDIQVKKVNKGAIQASLLDLDFGHAAQGEGHHAHDHEPTHHRHLGDIQALIEASDLSKRVKETTLDVFQRLAEAEARVHGTTIEEVHFHEVGALDSIIDTAGAAIGLEYFGIDRVYASALPWCTGQVETQHGSLPLPAPATLELLSMAHAPVIPSSAKVELVTPTGAAILATLATFEQPAMILTGVGIGAGQRELAWPNILRLILGESGETPTVPMVQIETNIDDMNPQLFGHVMGRLFAAGALDVYYTPIYMKKNRPATMLSVIARRSDEPGLARLILEETTTFGMRVQPITRYEAQRSIQTAETEYGPVPVKLKILDGIVIQAAPEYDACVRLAEEHGIPLYQVYTAGLEAGKPMLGTKVTAQG
jgi:uncharacterized protein (TIGR00299 family) protein